MNKKRPISRFESLAQGLIEGSLGRLLGGNLTPADIAARLTRVMEDSQLNGQAADHYNVRLHPADYDWLLERYPDLEMELQALLLNLAQQAKFALETPPQVTLLSDRKVRRHEIKAQATRQQPLPEKTQLKPEVILKPEQLAAIAERDAYLVINGRQHIPLNKPIINLGRRTDNDIVLDAPTVSRHHAQIRWRYGRFVLYDLTDRDSRTRVNNQPVTECVLQPGDVITLSNVNLLYAEGSAVPRRASGHRDDNTQVMRQE
ncbi:MAG: DUF3662 domain-containing protein [Chloroflexi bacterium]|nr:DUF3662 domain-containing protein [Chloroflexota bacterium]